MTETPHGETTAGALWADLRARGFPDPLPVDVGGVQALLVAPPDAEARAQWIADGSEDGLRVADVRGLTREGQLYALGAPATAWIDDPAMLDLDALRARAAAEITRTPCLLAYPYNAGASPPHGIQLRPAEAEDLWAIYVFDGALYFVRSWHGVPRYRAAFTTTAYGLFLHEIEIYGAPPADATLPVREVDFLIKAGLFRLVTPAPVAASFADDAWGAARAAFTAFGRLAQCASPDDTTWHRPHLNGEVCVTAPSPDDVAVRVIAEALLTLDGAAQRRRSLEALRTRLFHLALVHADESRRGEPLTRDTAVGVALSQWEGVESVFVYSDPAYCIDARDWMSGFSGRELVAFVRSLHPWARLVLNPGGPVTVVLAAADMDVLAEQA